MAQIKRIGGPGARRPQVGRKVSFASDLISISIRSDQLGSGAIFYRSPSREVLRSAGPLAARRKGCENNFEFYREQQQQPPPHHLGRPSGQVERRTAKWRGPLAGPREDIASSEPASLNSNWADLMQIELSPRIVVAVVVGVALAVVEVVVAVVVVVAVAFGAADRPRLEWTGQSGGQFEWTVEGIWPTTRSARRLQLRRKQQSAQSHSRPPVCSNSLAGHLFSLLQSSVCLAALGRSGLVDHFFRRRDHRSEAQSIIAVAVVFIAVVVAGAGPKAATC